MVDFLVILLFLCIIIIGMFKYWVIVYVIGIFFVVIVIIILILWLVKSDVYKWLILFIMWGFFKILVKYKYLFGSKCLGFLINLYNFWISWLVFLFVIFGMNLILLVVFGSVIKVLIFCCLKVCLIIVIFLLIDDFVELYLFVKYVRGIRCWGFWMK